MSIRQQSQKNKRDQYLQKTYGISLEQYNQLLKSQNNCCAICHKSPEQEGRNLAVDHDHRSKEIRGLLCFKCNHYVIGRHRDPDLLERAAEYLRKHTGWFVPIKKKKRKKRRK